ncbi:MAG: ribosome assembly RNA-binding protein YhbY [bacterium]|nr:ribosome assembly RNA-binding protein YhbY [bacterium]MDY4099085.1 ribosome assembly RNA-binding protein YhbY [Lachnospiraceae bacterium]
MEFTSKQRSYLKGLASNEDAIFQIGKSSITPTMVQAIDDAIEKRELIKISVLKNCMDDPHELADIVAERTRSNVVIVIGKKIVLYRPNKKNPRIVLPK